MPKLFHESEAKLQLLHYNPQSFVLENLGQKERDNEKVVIEIEKEEGAIKGYEETYYINDPSSDMT